MPGARRLGSAAEDRAADYLIQNGYTIIRRGFKSKRGEIDLVAMHGEVLVIVEVKERLKAGYVAEESVTALKARRLASAADEFIRANGELEREIRFDLICIDTTGLRHHVDAFRPS